MVAEFKEIFLLQTDPSSHMFNLLIILMILLDYYEVDGVQDVNPSTSEKNSFANLRQ